MISDGDTPSCGFVSDERPSDVLGALPRRRPNRRSDKRPPTPATERSASAPRDAWDEDTAGKRAPSARRAPAARTRGSRPARKPSTAAPRPERLRQPAQPAGVPKSARPAAPLAEPSQDHSTSRAILGIAAQAAAELAEIGLSVSARALRNAVNRLPRP
jgi:hypothetical protein